MLHPESPSLSLSLSKKDEVLEISSIPIPIAIPTAIGYGAVLSPDVLVNKIDASNASSGIAIAIAFEKDKGLIIFSIPIPIAIPTAIGYEAVLSPEVLATKINANKSPFGIGIGIGIAFEKDKGLIIFSIPIAIAIPTAIGHEVEQPLVLPLILKPPFRNLTPETPASQTSFPLLLDHSRRTLVFFPPTRSSAWDHGRDDDTTNRWGASGKKPGREIRYTPHPSMPPTMESPSPKTLGRNS